MPTHPHSCSYSVPTTRTPVPALNAIAPLVSTDRAQRRARHLAMCQRLAELGMELAEAAQREALRETQPLPERRAPALPGMPPHMAAPPPFRSTTFSELFTQVARCVRQAILLEARIEGGGFDHPAPAQRTPSGEPARSAPSQPDSPSEATRLGYERLEDDLAADAHRSPETILAGICGALGAAIETLPPASLPRPTPAIHRPANAATRSLRQPPPGRPPNERPPPEPG